MNTGMKKRNEMKVNFNTSRTSKSDLAENPLIPKRHNTSNSMVIRKQSMILKNVLEIGTVYDIDKN